MRGRIAVGAPTHLAVWDSAAFPDLDAAAPTAHVLAYRRRGPDRVLRPGTVRSSEHRDRSNRTQRQPTKLNLDPATVRHARSLARKAGRPIVKLATPHTTVSVERAVLRLAGITGADADGEPWVNHLVDEVRDQVGLEHGVALPVWDALRRGEYADLTALAQKAAAGSVTFRLPQGRAAHGAARGRAQAGRRPASRASTATDASGSGWSPSTATRPSRGST